MQQPAHHCIYIGGCGRSGTTLLLKLMRTFEDTHTVAAESTLRAFLEAPRGVGHLVVKRKPVSRFELPHLPEWISLVYCVRHPFDVLTSKLGEKNTKKNKQSYYISQMRWLSEYNSLNRLRARQPGRQICFIRYEDLVTDPDAVQERIAANLLLEVASLFSSVRAKVGARAGGNEGEGVRALGDQATERLIQPVKLHRWGDDADKMDYIASFETSFRRELAGFCDEFNYQLPDGFLRPDSRLTLLD